MATTTHTPLPVAPGSFRAWLLAARPATLTAAAAPVIAGTACAYYEDAFRLGPAIAAFAGAALIQIGTNFANDLYDYEKGTDREDRIGPVRAAQSGLLTPAQVRGGMAAVFGLAVLAGIYLAAVAGWPVIAIGLFSIISGIAYTGGPYPLGYNGLGDIFTFVFFGVVAVCGSAYVQALTIPESALYACIPIGALVTSILVVNNVRDCDTDRRSGKRTLAVRLGREAGIAEYAALLFVAYTMPLLYFMLAEASPWLLLPLASAPVAVFPALTVFRRTDGPSLNGALTSTARLLLLYSVLLAVGFVMAARSAQ